MTLRVRPGVRYLALRDSHAIGTGVEPAVSWPAQPDGLHPSVALYARWVARIAPSWRPGSPWSSTGLSDRRA